jgi:hypothetical protein
VSRYTAPLGFALVAIWAAVVFTILAAQPHKAPAHQNTTASTHVGR